MRSEEHRTNERNLGKAILLLTAIAVLLSLGATFLWTPIEPVTFLGTLNHVVPLVLWGSSYWYEPKSAIRVVLTLSVLIWFLLRWMGNLGVI